MEKQSTRVARTVLSAAASQLAYHVRWDGTLAVADVLDPVLPRYRLGGHQDM